MSTEPEAETRILETAVVRGWLSADDARQALSETQAQRAAGRRVTLIQTLAPRLSPEQLDQLRAHAQTLPPVAPTAQRIGPYTIEGELGRGGMGVIYRGRHPGLEREVAIKVLLAGEHASPGQLERFRLEARAAAHLRHPNIVAVHDVGVDQGCPYIVMDLVPGETLQDRIDRDGALAPEEAARITAVVADALFFAHSQAVLHRDVKPSNVIVTPDGTPFLTDFGLAKRTDEGERPRLTASGQFLGTPGFMPPEQACGRLDRVDRRSDVYALGATLYALLTGQAPFEDLETFALLAATLDADPTPPRSIEGTVPRDLETISLKCLEKEPERRYDSAKELAEDLRRFLADEPIQARPPGLGDRIGKWTRRNRTLASVLAGAATLLLLGGVGFAVYAARQEAALARAGEQKRSALAEEAKADLRAAAVDPTASVDRRIGQALLALQAAQRWRTLAPDDGEAARALYDAAAQLGELALEAEQWSLAAQAFEQARGLGVDDAAADAAVARVATARSAEAKRRAAEITRLLDDAASGKLSRTPGGVDDAVFRIVRYAEAQTVRLLAARLDGLTEKLLESEREVYREAAEPNAIERAGGERALEGGDTALLARRRHLLEGVVLPQAQAVVLRRLEDRLEARAAVAEAPPSAPMLVSARQEQRVGRGPLTAARIACRALGRIGLRADAVEPLARYATADADAGRLIPAGIALSRLGGRRGLQVVSRLFDRFGLEGPFASRVRPVFRKAESEPPADDGTPQAALARARYFESRGRGEEAYELYSRVLADQPTLWAARVGRARVGELVGRLDGSLKDLDAAIAADAANARAYAMRAVLHQRLGNHAKSRADVDKAIGLDSGDADAWNTLGQLLEKAGQMDRALHAYSVGIKLRPGDATMWCNRGSARSAQGKLGDAYADLTRALNLDPFFALAFNNRANVRRKQGDLAGALEDFSRALEIDPRYVPTWANRGHVRAMLGDAEGARSDYRRCLQLNPRWPAATEGLQQLEALKVVATGSRGAREWIRRALAHQRAGRLGPAMRDMTRALHADPRSIEAWVRRASLRRSAFDFRGALKDMDRALALSPGDGALLMNRGLMLAQLDRHADAIAEYTQALRVRPDLVNAYYNRGVAQATLGKNSEALRDFAAACKRSPSYAAAWSWRGIALRRLDKPAEAVACFDRALRLTPRDAITRANRALARIGSKDLKGALQDAQVVLRTRSDLALAWFARGLARGLAGQKAAGLRDLSRALRLGLQEPERSTARAAMASLRRR